jgi:hypothetical protein
LLIGGPAALATGWASAGAPADPGLDVSARPVNVPMVEHSGLQVSMAAGVFRRLGLSAPQEIVPVADDLTPETPAEPPVEETFARELTAILELNGRPAVLLVDPSAQDQRRRLTRGQEYRNGWVVSAILDQEIVLRRDGDERRVSVFGVSAT